jgi:MEDS: MEthanogen/methylotroph, DcmR Sensory domain
MIGPSRRLSQQSEHVRDTLCHAYAGRQDPGSGGSPAWRSVLTGASPGQHIAQLYSEPAFLARAVSEFAGEALRRGDGFIAIVRPFNWKLVARRLEAVVDVQALEHRGQLVVRDAEATLGMLLVDGTPDAERFRTVIGGAVDGMRAAGYPRIRAFGEMVDLLRRTDVTATIRLEQVWNEFLSAGGVTLLCGYSLDPFDPRGYRGLVQGVCTEHTDLIPVEDYAGLQRAVERAYLDVFGVGGDADRLRRAFLDEYPRPSVMPDAAAALLAARHFVPGAADALLERARHHYLESASGLPSGD